MAKALTVFAVDIGPHMHMDIELVAEALRTYFLSKVVNKARDECALLYFGSNETRNAVHEEMAAQGSSDDYLHIVEEHSLKPPDQAYLQGLEPGQMPRGQGRSDFIDAVSVAADILNKAVELRPELEKHNVTKEIVLISSLQERVKEAEVHEFVAALVESLKGHDVQLQTVLVDIEKQGDQADREFNREILSELVEEIRHKDIVVQTPAELLGVFKCKEYSNTAYYAGPFTVGPNMNIRVKVAKKAKKEMLPSTKLYSDRSTAPDATHEVQREHEYKDASDPDTIVPPEERQKSYKYGKQFVPVSVDDEGFLAYKPERGIHLLGFMPAESIPQYQHLKDPWVMVAEKNNEMSGTALAALVRALHNKQSVALILFLPRVSEKTGGNPAVCAGTPVLGSGAGPDHLVLNHLPFAEDLRVAKFTSFEAKADLLPSEQQVQCMSDLVQSLDLHSDMKELLAADATRNPTIHRFYNHAACQASGREYPLPEPQEDVLVRETFLPNGSVVSGSQALLDSLPELLPIVFKETAPGMAALKDEEGGELSAAAFTLEGAAAPAVSAVGTSDPISDFNAMVRQENLDGAFRSMPDAIVTLVQNSMGNRNYQKALHALQAMREAAIQHGRGASFNSTLEDLRSKFKGAAQHQSFWQLLMDQQVTLVSDEEDPGSEVSAAEADNFLKQHASQGQVVDEEPAAMAVDEEADEFADMD